MTPTDQHPTHQPPAMIDLIQYGEMRATLTHLQHEIVATRVQSAKDIEDLRRQNAEQTEALNRMLETINQAKGGWRIMMLFGGAAGTLGAGIATIIMNILASKPPTT